MDISESIPANIEIPSRDDSGGSGPLGGSTTFTVRYTQTKRNGKYEGYGYLDMSTASAVDPSDQWIIDVLLAAAELDTEASGSKYLLQCCGLYDRDNDQTNSYGAKWITGTKTVNVKVDWSVSTEGHSDGKSHFDFQLYVSEDDQWEVNYDIDEYIDVYYNIKYEYNPSTDGAYDGTYTYDGYVRANGKTIDLSQSSETDAGGVGNDGEIEDAIAEVIQGLIDEAEAAMSGKIHMWTDPEFTGLEWESTGSNTGKAEETIQIYNRLADHRQIFTRRIKFTQPAEIKLTINKSIKNKGNYSSNFFDLDEYDLSGTEFWLYTSDESGAERIRNADGDYAVMTIPNATGGISNEIKLEAKYGNSTIYLEEHLPSTATGYKTQYNKAGSRYALTLPAAGKSHTEPIENEPIVDPVMLVIKKISPTTSDGKPIADIDYNDIKYTLSYFGESPSAKSNAYANTGTKNTWVFATKEQDEYGRINFTDEFYKVSGDTLYKVGSTVHYPVGWYRIQENPDQTKFLHNKGLELSKDIYYVHIFNDNNVAKLEIYKGNELYESPDGTTIAETREGKIFEPEHWEPFAFAKKDIHLSSGKPEGDTKLEGAVFTVYSEDANRFGTSTEYDGHTYSIGSGNVVLVDGNELTIIIDSDGRGICKYPLPKTDNTIGKRFYITETTAPLGYKANDVKYYVDFQKRITVKDYNDNTISLSIKNMETGTTSNETEIYSITYGANNLNVNEVSVPYVNGTAYNTPRKGIIEIEKFDDDYGAVRNKYFFVQFAEKI